MSGGALIVTAVNPWAMLRASPDVTLHVGPLPDGQAGETCYDTWTVTIAPGLKQRERNDALAHELIHLERGPAPPAYAAADERAVEEEAARRLIPLAALLDALRWTRDLHQLAVELHCTVETVRVRFATMRHPAERAAVRRVLDDVESP